MFYSLSFSASILTCSRTLTQVPIVDFPSLKRALEILHIDFQVPNVVISSIPLYPWLIPILPSAIKPSDSSTPHLLCVSSQISGDRNSNHVSTVSAACVPHIPGYFSGVGDLFSALLLGHYNPQIPHGNEVVQTDEMANDHSLDAKASADPLRSATSFALSVTHAILSFTHARISSLPDDQRPPTDDELDASEPLRLTRRMRGRELALVQARHLITDKDAAPRYELLPWTGFWA